MYGEKAVLNKYVPSCFFSKSGYSFIRYSFNKEFFPDCWRSYPATEKGRLPIFSIALGINRLFVCKQVRTKGPRDIRVI